MAKLGLLLFFQLIVDAGTVTVTILHAPAFETIISPPSVMTVHPGMELGFAFDGERVDDLHMRKPVRLDLEFEQLRIVENIDPLMAFLESLPGIGVVALPEFAVEETLPTVRVFFRLAIPIRHRNGTKGLLDLDHAFPGAAATPKIAPPMVFFSADFLENLSQNRHVWVEFRLPGQHIMPYPATLDGFLQGNAGCMLEGSP